MFRRNGYSIVLMSSIILVLCLLVISLGTYSLFSQTVSVKTHLRAGVLETKLERINLKYNKLNSLGLLEDYENIDNVDFTNTSSTNKNIFDLSNDVLLVPGNYYEATMVLSNEGDVAFNYWLEIIVQEEVKTSLSQQIKIVVTTYQEEGEVEKTSFLNEGLLIGSELLPLDEVLVNEEKTFKVRIEFIHSDMNNSAMEEEVNFDLTVYAVQKVNK